MKRFFTLIELLVVIAIIALLAGLIIAKMGNFENEAREAANTYSAATVERQLENFKAAYGRYPGGFHTGYTHLTPQVEKEGQMSNADITDADIEPNFPTALRLNYVNGATTVTDLPGIYWDGKVTMNLAEMSTNIGSHTTGAQRCGISLQRAGITAVTIGDVKDLASLGTNPLQTVKMNSYEVRLMHANYFFTAWNDDGTPNNSYELKIKGHSLREWYGRSYGSFEKVTCVIPLFITEGFNWRAYNDSGDLIVRDYNISAGKSKASDTAAEGFVCFFVCDMLPNLDGRDPSNPRPAELLGVVSMDEFINATNK